MRMKLSTKSLLLNFIIVFISLSVVSTFLLVIFDYNILSIELQDIKRDENINTIIDSDTTNTTNTNTTSNTSNSTLNNIDETLNIDINETNINESDNIKSTKTNEINVITENGFEIPLSELVLKYRETFLNVDLQIINELKDLFMMIY